MMTDGFPKEAWYEGRLAGHVYGNVYYVWRGEWSDPVYVLAENISDVLAFGACIKGKEVGYFDVWGRYGENENPTPADIAADVEELSYLVSV